MKPGDIVPAVEINILGAGYFSTPDGDKRFGMEITTEEGPRFVCIPMGDARMLWNSLSKLFLSEN